MVDLLSPPSTAVVGASADLRSFETLLRGISLGKDPCVRGAALAVLRRIELTTPVSARSFDQVYYEVLRQELLLRACSRRADWRVVKEVSVTVYHALLRDFRDQVRRRHRSHAKITESRHPHRGRHAASVLP